MTTTDFDDRPSATQQMVELPFISNEECTDKFKDVAGVDLSGQITSKLHLCAGGNKDDEKDTCKVPSHFLSNLINGVFQGDSGGPLLFRVDEYEPWILVGIISGGTNQCGQGAPSISTRVSHYMDWIQETLEGFADDVPEIVSCTTDQDCPNKTPHCIGAGYCSNLKDEDIESLVAVRDDNPLSIVGDTIANFHCEVNCHCNPGETKHAVTGECVSIKRPLYDYYDYY